MLHAVTGISSPTKEEGSDGQRQWAHEARRLMLGGAEKYVDEVISDNFLLACPPASLQATNSKFNPA